eukprot:CAMPEP_0117440178 /NCGR_PEP_ID=MMETSP0759-20121206/2950_1 /TAXON_ID=63605 /ORGANISM="Percolomonas cosmopolitus, Strain WS" /LENGTH=115 /DNA_ID=CAMNT_0005231923 /DNA_START=80 /DNA_END=427 /DNA_ORIENTATION=-
MENLQRMENGFSYQCHKCQKYIGDDFDVDSIIIRKDLVKEVLQEAPAEDQPVDADQLSPESLRKDIDQLKSNVVQLRSSQDEIKRAIMTLKDSFEGQMVDIKRSILHLASEIGKV